MNTPAKVPNFCLPDMDRLGCYDEKTKSEDLGYGDNYKYAHNYENNFAEAEFLPEEIKNTMFYQPGNNQREQAQREFLKKRWTNKYDY